MSPEAPSLQSIKERTELVTAIDTFNQVRKWNISFDGKRDVAAFIEQISELAEEYGVSEECVIFLVKKQRITLVPKL